MAQLESFFWGIIAALGALVAQLILYVGFSTYAFPATASLTFSQVFAIPTFIIIGALVEEIFKYIVISKRLEMFSIERSYLTNSLLAGLGFFSIELGLVLATGATLPLDLLGEIAIVHIGTAGIIGYIVATKNPKKIGTFIHAVLFTAFFHSAYNLLILDRTVILNYAVFVLLATITLINVVNFIRINRKLAQQ